MKYIKITYCKTVIWGGFIGITVFVLGILIGYSFYKEDNLTEGPFSSQSFPYYTVSMDSTNIEIIKRKEKNGIVEFEAIVKNKKLLEELTPLQIIVSIKDSSCKKEIISKFHYILPPDRTKIKVKRRSPSSYIEIGYLKKKDLYLEKIPKFYSKIFY